LITYLPGLLLICEPFLNQCRVTGLFVVEEHWRMTSVPGSERTPLLGVRTPVTGHDNYIKHTHRFSTTGLLDMPYPVGEGSPR